MKKETISKIEKEINQKIALPRNIKEKIKKDIFTNIIIAISMIVYFTFLMMGSVGATKAVRSIDFNIFSILILGVTICLFEIAYRKENGTLEIYGIETLIVSVITLFFPYIIFELDEFYKKYYMIVSAYIAVYYIIKSICIVSKAKKIHIKQSSDIKEIIKKEKRKDVIRVKEKENNIKIQKTIERQNVETAPKKRGRPKKSETTNNANKNNVGVAALPQGHVPSVAHDVSHSWPNSDPQREQTKKLEKKNNENKQKESDTPKKRGRPRKVVTVDD